MDCFGTERLMGITSNPIDAHNPIDNVCSGASRVPRLRRKSGASL